MIYEVDGWNNFCRVFLLPDQFPTGFCFGGGITTTFTMVDWFNPVPGIPAPAISKEEWLKVYDDYKSIEVDHKDLHQDLVTFIAQKTYIIPGKNYLIICDFGAALLFKAPKKNG